MVLFLANFVGAIVMVPLKKRTIPFGPFLVGATVVVIALNVVLLGLKP